jgi:hypothetical protein
LHEKEQPPDEQVAVALATLVEQTVEQLPQWLALLVVSTQLPLHCVGVALGHADAQA